jgi:D-sedoheptulose 7-phosphate isomerase
MSIDVKTKLCQQLEPIAAAAKAIVQSLRMGRKLIIFGNGGSAGDAQHIAAEFVGRFQAERRALPAIALTTDTSTITAIGNDYGFDRIFERQVEALGNSGDVALAISTSGNSPNVLRGLEATRELDLFSIGLTGASGGQMKERADICVCVPSDSTPRIQEAHILIGHILCRAVEQVLFGFSPACYRHSKTSSGG